LLSEKKKKRNIEDGKTIRYKIETREREKREREREREREISIFGTFWFRSVKTGLIVI
jgi:hypothetical protein